MFALVPRMALALSLLLAVDRASVDTANVDPSFNPPFGFAKVISYLAGGTYLSSRTNRLLIDDAGNHYQVGTGQTAVGVSPAQAAITIVSLNSLGELNSSFFGTGRRAFKLAPGGVLTDTVVTDAFRHYVVVLRRRTLNRRSQKANTTWSRMTQIATDFLPPARISHPWPSVRFAANHPRWEPGA